MNPSRSLWHPLKSVARSEGAVMVMGVFMAVGLVGAVWYVIGLGDALIYRDHVQEAADSVAFSAAVVHARGMNFIAAVNLIMLVMTAIFLLIRVVEDVFYKIEGLTGGCHGHIHWGCVAENALVPTACTVCKAARKANKALDHVRKDYHDRVLTGVLPALGKIQDAVQTKVAPYGAVAAGLFAGTQYKEVGIALSASLYSAKFASGDEEPGNACAKGKSSGSAVEGEGESCDPEKRGRFGLPLENNPFGFLCGQVVQDIADWVDAQIKKIPVVGKVIDIKPVRNKINGVINGLAKKAVIEYCRPNDGDVWGQKGFKTVHSDLANGAPAFQVFGIVPSSRKIAEDAFGGVLGAGHVGIAPRRPKIVHGRAE